MLEKSSQHKMTLMSTLLQLLLCPHAILRRKTLKFAWTASPLLLTSPLPYSTSFKILGLTQNLQPQALSKAPFCFCVVGANACKMSVTSRNIVMFPLDWDPLSHEIGLVRLELLREKVDDLCGVFPSVRHHTVGIQTFAQKIKKLPVTWELIRHYPQQQGRVYY